MSPVVQGPSCRESVPHVSAWPVPVVGARPHPGLSSGTVPGQCACCLRWSWCFGVGGGAAAAGVPVCPGLSPEAASIGSCVPGLPCRAQVRYSAVKLVETAVSARKFWSPLSPLPFTVPEFSVLPEVCPGAAGVRTGRGVRTGGAGDQGGGSPPRCCTWTPWSTSPTSCRRSWT